MVINKEVEGEKLEIIISQTRWKGYFNSIWKGKNQILAMYIFDKSPQENINTFMERIKFAQNDANYQRFSFDEAVRYLIGLYDSMADEHSDFKNSTELRVFYKESSKELITLWRDLNAFADITCFMAEGANDNEWYELCIRRSILYILVNDYKDTEVMKYIELNDIEELDIELKRVGLEQGPIREDFIPRGLSKEHWWWYYPEKEK